MFLWILAAAATARGFGADAAGPASEDFGAPAPATGEGAASALGRTIAWVRYEPFWLRSKATPLVPGEILTQATLSAELQAAAGDATRRGERFARATGIAPLSVTYVTPEFELAPPGDAGGSLVGVTIRVFHVTLPVDEMNERAMPMPRALPPEWVDPANPLSAVSLKPSVTLDRALGTSVGARSTIPLGRAARAHELRLELGGTRSVDEVYYSGDAALRFQREWGGGLLRGVSAALEGAAALEPRGPADFRSTSIGGGGGVTLAPHAGAKLLLGIGYRRERDACISPAGFTGRATTHDQTNRLIYEAIPPRLSGFVRTALWHNSLDSERTGMAQRVIARGGYAREFPLGFNRTVGVELLAGAGQTWGRVEGSRRYFGGGGQGEFLYESLASSRLSRAPEGPLLRSVGRAQAGLRSAGGGVLGGTSFWHVNMNVSLPIARWSQPLIPNEPTDLPGPGGAPLTLKQMLTRQVDNTGPNMLAASLQESDRLSPEEARRRATEVFHEIQPAAKFIIEQANLFAVKPLLLLDAAELRGPGQSAFWVAGGGGLQLTVVTAKLELGYMRTLKGPTFGSRGNVFGRLGFERLF